LTNLYDIIATNELGIAIDNYYKLLRIN